MEFQSCCLQLFPYRFDESCDIAVARFLCSVQFLLYVVVHIVLRIFQRQVFQFRLQLIQSQFVCERSIKVCSFVGHLEPRFLIGAVFDLPHQVDAVGYDYQDNPHVFCERQQEIPEVFRFDGRAFVIKFVDFYQPPYDSCHIFSVFFFYSIEGTQVIFHRFVQHDSQDRSSAHSYFFRHDYGGLDIFDDRVHAKHVARDCSRRHVFYQMSFQFPAVILQQSVFR